MHKAGGDNFAHVALSTHPPHLQTIITITTITTIKELITNYEERTMVYRGKNYPIEF
ncbi:MAG: hypothetical protein ABJB76_00805 [Candidatus Nitrosocosmicus sp.]